MEKRLNIWIRLTLAMLVTPLLQWGMTLFTGMFAGIVMNESGAPVAVSNHLLLAAVSSAIAFLLATVLFTVYADRQQLEVIGYQWARFKSNGWKGALVAVFILCFSALLLSVAELVFFTGVHFNPAALIPLLIAMALVAVGEEFFFRGYIQRNAMENMSKSGALFFTAILFTIMHMGNPSQNWLALPGVFAGGLLLGINYAFTKNVWFGILLHWTWNFLQGPILGFPVSGFSLDSLLKQTQQGPALLTGGTFGLEASLLTILLTLTISMLLWKQFSFQEKSVDAMAGQ